MIKVDDLSFSYTERDFLQNINFEVGKGEILGFLGPSGAGKSTLQKILIGMITNYGGSVIVNGVESKRHSNKFYENIGVDFEFPSLYEKLTAIENLKYFGSLYSKKLLSIDELLKSVGLENEANKRVSEYSKGMKSRLNFIKALLHNPDILFLDEPTSGLDPLMQNEFVNLILEEKRRGKTILMSSHIFEEVEKTCNRVGIIKQGKIVSIEDIDTLRKSKHKIYAITFKNIKDIDRFKKENFSIKNINNNVVEVVIQNEINELIACLNNYQIINLDIVNQSLEEIFMHFYGGEVDHVQ